MAGGSRCEHGRQRIYDSSKIAGGGTKMLSMKMSRAPRCCAFAAALSVGLILAGEMSAQAQSASGEPIKIGVLEDRSGVVAFISQEHVKALKAAADSINRGQLFYGAAPVTSGKPGILGRPIQ